MPGATLVVPRKPVSTSSRLTSIWIGPLPARRSTPPGFNAAPVTLTSNDMTVTPAGGASIIVRLAGVEPAGGGLLEELPLQPAIAVRLKTNREANKRFTRITILLTRLDWRGFLWNALIRSKAGDRDL